MGIADSFREMAGKAKEKMDPEKAKRRVDKAGDRIDNATGGRYSNYVDRGQNAAKSRIDRMREEDENQPR